MYTSVVSRALLVLVLCLVTWVAGAGELRLAVAPFTNASPDPAHAPLGKGLQSMFATDLSYLPGVEVVERERLAELTQELELGQEGWLDPETAAETGRLSGATHVVAGSYVLVGDTMRLDARLFSVLEGKVVLARASEGERDLFFELQKELVGALAVELAVDGLPPKVRVKVQRVHTADFGAFESFSRGLEAFDTADYEEALQDLRQATVADEDFKLAALTLEDYERLVAQIQARSQALADVEREKRELDQALATEQALAAEVQMVDRLLELASTKGNDARPERLAALWMLWRAYLHVDFLAPIPRLDRRGDHFAMARLGERLARQYFAEAQPLWPRVPLSLDTALQLEFPRQEHFDEDLAQRVALLYGTDNAREHATALWQGVGDLDRTARILRLDQAEQVELMASLVDRGPLSGDFTTWLPQRLVRDQIRVLMLDEAARRVASQAAATDDAGTARALGELAADAHALKLALDGASDPRWAREFMLLSLNDNRSLDWVAKQAQTQLSGAQPTAEGWELLLEARQWRSSNLMLLSDQPAWLVQGRRSCWSGPRPDPRRTEALVYADEAPREPALLMLGEEARTDHRATLGLDYQAATDRPGPHPSGRPQVSWLLGLVDVAVDEVIVDNHRQLQRPMRGVRVRVGEDELVVERITESRRESGAKVGFEVVELGRAPLTLADQLELEVRVKGRKLRAGAGDAEVEVDLEQVPEGYTGVWIEGAGLVEVRPTLR